MKSMGEWGAPKRGNRESCGEVLGHKRHRDQGMLVVAHSFSCRSNPRLETAAAVALASIPVMRGAACSARLKCFHVDISCGIIYQK